jgi:hypothetical protein
MKGAHDIFFDWGSGGKVLKSLQGGELLRAVQPFFGWTYYATDVPGVKKGLLSRMLDHSGGWMSATNDLKLQARNTRRAIELMMRRSAIFSASRAVQDKERDLLGDVAGWEPGGVNMVMALLDDDPKVVNIHERPGMDMLNASSTALRIGPAAMHAVFGKEWQADDKWDDKTIKRWYGTPAKFKAAQKKQRQYWLNFESGRDVSVSQTLGAIGFGGGLLAKELIRASEDAPLDKARVTWRIARMVMGGTPADTLDSAISTMWPESALSTRKRHPTTGEYEDVARMWTRKLLTLGVRPKLLSDAQDGWLKRRGRHLRSTYEKVEKEDEGRRLQARRGKGEPADRTAVRAEYRMLKRVADEEVKRLQKLLREQRNAWKAKHSAKKTNRLPQ